MATILSEIYIYPIKSLGGISVKSAKVEERGLKYDRRWMLVDVENEFLTQRTNHQMAWIDVSITENGLWISHRQKTELKPLVVPFLPETENQLTVNVWGDKTIGTEVSQEANEWFSEALGQDVRLVFMTDSATRPVDATYAPFDANVSFADGYPYLVISQSALNLLNQKLETPVTMQSFRPNFVVENTEPHEEDTWRDFRINNIAFVGVKPCARCIMTTIDPATAESGKEPLQTLAKYRKRGNKILFGQNVLARTFGEVNVGDELIIG